MGDMGDKDPEGGQEEGRRGGKSEGTGPKAGEQFSKGIGEYKWYNGNPNGPGRHAGPTKPRLRKRERTRTIQVGTLNIIDGCAN